MFRLDGLAHVELPLEANWGMILSYASVFGYYSDDATAGLDPDLLGTVADFCRVSACGYYENVATAGAGRRLWPPGSRRRSLALRVSFGLALRI